MRLSCAIVSRILAARTAGEATPAWVERHLEQCERCRVEAAEYSRLSERIKNGAATAEALALTWQELRAALPVRETRPAFRIPVFVTAAAAAAIVAALCLGLLMQGPKQKTNVAIKQGAETQSSRQPQFARKAPAPQQLVVRRAKQPAAPEVKQSPAPRFYLAEHRDMRHTLPHRGSSPRVHNAPQPDAPTSVASSGSTDGPRTLDSPSYTVVGAEEHVIDVVGVSSTNDSSDSNTGYVIRTTDTGDDHQATLL